jgi:UDP-glucose 4-epimerase
VHVLVTGGAGFIGSVLVDRLLAEGHQVDVIDNLSTGSLSNLAEARRARRDLTFHQVDVRSPEVVELVARRRPEMVFHLAGQASVEAGLADPAFDADVNIVGTLRIAEAARAAGSRKLVVTSSATAVYGEPQSGDLPLAEHQPRRPASPHGLAKHAVDGYLVALRQYRGLEFTSLVIGTVYGPRDNNGVVGLWARALMEGQACVVNGDGSQTRDFVFVDDVADALARTADGGGGLVLNIGTGAETSLATLHGLLVQTFLTRGAKLSETARTLLGGPARPADVKRCAVDATRAGIHLNWRSWTPLGPGLEATVEWATANTAGTPDVVDPATGEPPELPSV